MASFVKQTKKDKLFSVCNYIYVTLAFILVAYPVVYMISASISDPKLVSSGEMWMLPKGITWEGYKKVFENNAIWIGYANTILYTVVGTVINLFVTLPAAYALSRKDFWGRGFFMGMFMITMFFGGGLVPTYLLVKSLGMIDTIWAIVFPSAASIWNIIVARTFFQSTIPNELQEAAQIDGCTNMRLFIKIVLPLSMPIIAVMALFYGVGNWNSYFSAMIYLVDSSKYPLQLVLRQILILQEASSVGAGLDAAAATALNNKAEVAALVKYAVIIVSTLPIIMIYPFLQRYFVQGIMIGSVKG